MEYTIRIAGEAGQGIQTIGSAIGRVFSRSGFHVFTHQDYMSRVRGGHNFYQIRVSDKPVSSSRRGVDILIALNEEAIERHHGSVTSSGLVIYDKNFIKKDYDQPGYLHIPFEEIASEEGGNRIFSNTVATGAVLGMLQIDLEIYTGILREVFSKKGNKVVDDNIKAARAGYEYARENCNECSFSMEANKNRPLLILNGNQAIGYGALVSGCRFYSAYPMTPSTGIMVYLASKALKHGIIVEQAEDEISAINMALGASFAGVRAMTGSSGGGFALMVEGLSLAGMTETPIVIAEVQRPGPATGLPTRTEQGDLLFLLHAGHGEFPRILFAPGSPEQAVYLTNRAFDLAEKYQIPAFVLSDQYLADSEWTFESLDRDALICNDYRLKSPGLSGPDNYKRHSITPTGVSPLAVPGSITTPVITDSDEHDEEGHMIEDAETRIAMVEKRLWRKLPAIREELSPPLYEGPDEPDLLLVGWGSTYGVMKDTILELPEEMRGGFFHFSEICPLPVSKLGEFLETFRKARLTIAVENNATGQFERYLRAELGIEFTHHIRKYDGRPFILDDLVHAIEELIKEGGRE